MIEERRMLKRIAALFVGSTFYDLPPRDREICNVLAEARWIKWDDVGVISLDRIK